MELVEDMAAEAPPKKHKIFGTRYQRGTINDRGQEPFHLDRNISIFSLIALIGTFISCIASGAVLINQVHQDSKRITETQLVEKDHGKKIDDLSVAMARVEGKQETELSIMTQLGARAGIIPQGQQ